MATQIEVCALSSQYVFNQNQVGSGLHFTCRQSLRCYESKKGPCKHCAFRAGHSTCLGRRRDGATATSTN